MFCKNDFDMHARPTLGVKWPMCQELKWPMCQESCPRWIKVGVLLVENLFDLLDPFSVFWADVTFNSQCVQSSATAYEGRSKWSRLCSSLSFWRVSG